MTLATLLFLTFVVTTLAVLSWYDIRERIIPNRIVLPAWAIVLAAQMALRPERWAEWSGRYLSGSEAEYQESVRARA